jgi:hypothetical protein
MTNKFELSDEGLKKLWELVTPVLGPIVDDLCDKANETLTPDREIPGYMCAVERGHKGRPVGHVWAQGQYAKNSNAAYNTLVRLLYGMSNTGVSVNKLKTKSPSRLLAADRRAHGGEGMTWAEAVHAVLGEAD